MTRMAGFLAALVIGGAGGCSSLHVYEGSIDAEGTITIGDDVGVQYYQPAYFLRVTEVQTTKNGQVTASLQTELLTLPDFEQPRFVRPAYSLGSLEWSVELIDGWRLKTLNGKADPQVDELITSLASFVPTISAMAMGPEETERRDTLEPGLYRVELDSSGAIVLRPVTVLANP